MSARPPRLVRTLLSLLLPRSEREFQLGDIEEEFAERGRSDPAAARAWYRRQAALALAHRLRRRGSRPGEPARGWAAPFARTVQDVRYAGRSLRKAPGHSLTAAVTLALGIGANAAIFTVLDHALLRPLPFPEPQRLVRVYNVYPDQRPGRWNLSFPDFADLDAATETIELAAWRAETPALTLDDGSQAVRVRVSTVTANLLPMLGVEPRIGRGISPDDDAVDAGERVALVSHAMWRDALGGDSSALGREVRLDGAPYVVVGVVPPGLGGGVGAGLLPAWETDFWLPYRNSMAVEGIDLRGLTNVAVVGRLAGGASLEQASAEARSVALTLAESHPDVRADETFGVFAAQEVVRARSRRTLVLLYAAVSVVLLIAGTNLAHLLLGRNATRGREIAVRMALGAGRGRIVRQLLAESALLALGGAALGWALGWTLLRALARSALLQVPGAGDPVLDLRVLGAMAVVALLTGLVFGSIPALRTSRRDPQATLRTDTQTSTGGGLVRRTLAVAELALAVVLLVGATLMLQSLQRVTQTDPGFEPGGMLTARLQLPMAFVDPEWPTAVAFFAELLERLEALPGVESAVAAYMLPVETGWNNSFELPDGREPPAGQNDAYARFRPVTPGYFEASGIRVLRGRGFRPDDRSGAPGVVIVNEAFVRRYFPVEDPLGARLGCSNWWRAFDGGCEIVGIVEDVHFDGRTSDSLPATYFPHAQQPVREMSVLLRTRGDPLAQAAALRAEVAFLDPGLPLDAVATLQENLEATELPRRAIARLLGSFAVLALTLAGVGVYGVMSFLVARRTREIGIRMALGAGSRQVRRMVLREGLLLAAIGAAIGTAAAAGLSRFLESQLHEVGRHDPVAFTVAAVVLGTVALLACWLPAARATHVDPMRSLRAE